MDVISLLNTNALPVEQQKEPERDTEEKRAEAATKNPIRNRTPWDAGGYALPINTISNPSTSPPRHDEVRRRDSETYPKSPRHRLSDSRSSCQSFTSSLQSACHSRFSSLSTVGSAYPTGTCTEAGKNPSDFSFPSIMDASRPTMGYSTQGGNISPTGPLAALALVAENEMAGQRAQEVAEAAISSPIEENATMLRKGGDRPCSPSDAILIKRSAAPNLRLCTGDKELKSGLNRMSASNLRRQAHP